MLGELETAGNRAHEEDRQKDLCSHSLCLYQLRGHALPVAHGSARAADCDTSNGRALGQISSAQLGSACLRWDGFSSSTAGH